MHKSNRYHKSSRHLLGKLQANNQIRKMQKRIIRLSVIAQKAQKSARRKTIKREKIERINPPYKESLIARVLKRSDCLFL